MITETHLTFFSAINFMGIFLGLMLSYLFIKKGSKNSRANIYQGALLLSLSIIMLEEFLNDTGYIVTLLPIFNFSEPLNFAIAPLFYFYVRHSLYPDNQKKVWPHFMIALFWLIYTVFLFIQPNEVKYNLYIQTKHPEYAFLDAAYHISDDPLGIRHYINVLTPLHFCIYMFFAIRLFLAKCKRQLISIWTTESDQIRTLRNIIIHFVAIIAVFIIVKLSFHGDIGDPFITTYFSFMIISATFRLLNNSNSFDQNSSFMDFPLGKYKKSSLTNETKEELLKKILVEFNQHQYFLNNMASLSGLSKTIKESSHHVSQVINEKLGMNFFELLAKYRIEEAQKMIRDDKDKKITIEELAEKVGYNSKSAFNNAFKKLTSKTPSEFRETDQTH